MSDEGVGPPDPADPPPADEAPQRPAKAAPRPAKAAPRPAKAAAKKAVKKAVKKAAGAPRTGAAKKATEATGARPLEKPVAGPPPAPPPPPPAPPPPPPPPQQPSWPPPPGPPGGGWPPPGYAPAPGRSVEGLAVAALVLGLVSILFFVLLVPAILAVVLGAVARRNIKNDPNKTGSGMATVGVVLGILSLVGAVVFYVAAIASDDGFDDRLRYDRVQPGDCYEDPGGRAGEVALESCADEHDREAFAVIDHPAPDGADFPGRESLRRYADEECTTRFSAYVGETSEESDLEVVFILPSRDAWEDDDLRRIVCAVADPDEEPLVGTVRDSAS